MANAEITNKQRDLHHIGVILTRPRGQSEHAIKMIKLLNGMPFEVPGLTILEIDNPNQVRHKFTQVRDYDYLLFTSPNAVEYAIRYNLDFDQKFKIIAIGLGTEKAISDHTDKKIITAPKPYTSEALIDALQIEDLKDKKILLVSGEGGRRILGDSLRDDYGAITEYIDVYRREAPRLINLSAVKEYLKKEHPLVLFISSQESLGYIHAALLKENLVDKINTVIVGSDRLKSVIEPLGYRKIIVAASALEMDFLQALWDNISSIASTGLENKNSSTLKDTKHRMKNNDKKSTGTKQNQKKVESPKNIKKNDDPLNDTILNNNANSSESKTDYLLDRDDENIVDNNNAKTPVTDSYLNDKVDPEIIIPAKDEDKVMPQTKTAKPTTAPTQPSTPKKRSGSPLAITACAFALLSTGLSIYTYYEFQQKENVKTPTIDPTAILKEETSRLKADVYRLTTENEDLSQRTSELENSKVSLNTDNISDETIRIVNQKIVALSQEVNNSLTNLSSSDQSMQERLDILNRSIQKLSSDLDTQKTLVVTASTKADEAKSTMSRVETRIAESILDQDSTLMRAKNLIQNIEQSIDVEALQIAEIRYLLKIAIYKAQFEYDVSTAISALEEARKLMLSVESIEFVEALKRLDDRLIILKEISQINYDVEAEKLIEVSQLIYQAPLKDESAIQRLKEDFLNAADEIKKNSGDQPWYKNVAKNLSPVFVVESKKAVPLEIIANDDAFFLNQNILLQLSAARISLLQNHPDSFYSSIKHAHEWITEYYDDMNSNVAKAREILRLLSELQFTTEIPDLTPILVGFEATLDVRRGN